MITPVALSSTPRSIDMSHPARRVFRATRRSSLGYLVFASLMGCGGELDLRGPAYVDPAAVGTYPADPETVQGWIDSADRRSIRAHAWDIWAAITAPTDDPALPVWQTWYSGHELFEMEAEVGRRQFPDFERPHQFTHSEQRRGVMADPAERAAAFNRYSASLAANIRATGLNSADTLNAVNARFDATNAPVAGRAVSTSRGRIDASQIVLKPVFQLISGAEPTGIPYWAGNSAGTTTDTLNPEPHTWKQCVAIDPTGAAAPGSRVQVTCNGALARIPVVPVEYFYHFTLSATQAEAFSTFAIGSSDDIGRGNFTDSSAVRALIQEGNIALLVAMHVATKEIENWTWQTFWWARDPEDPTYGADRPSTVSGPWAHYNMNTAYYMVEPPGDRAGAAVVSFNPYLETNLRGTYTTESGRVVSWTGVSSNCMTCHRVAAWKPNPSGSSQPNHLTPRYRDNGFIDPADANIFGSFTKLDFLWSLTRAQ